jgi:transposase-like protein
MSFGIKEDQNMPRKKHTPEEIVAKLRQGDVLVSQGVAIAGAVRQIGVTEVTYSRWRQECGGVKLDQVKRLTELELENARLRKAVSDLNLDRLILKEAAREHGRLGYRKIAAMLRNTSSSVVNDKRVERIWRQDGLKVPPRQPKRSRMWPGDGACIRLRAERPNPVWSSDFVEDRTRDGRK